MIGTTSFDGLSQGELWTGPDGLGQRLQRSLVDLGFSQQTALEIAFTIGLLAMVLRSWRRSSGSACRGCAPSPPATTRPSWRGASCTRSCRSRWPTSSPTTSRCWPTRARRWPTWPPTRSATAATCFGTAGQTVDYGVISATGIWYVQVGALVIGHVAGLALAHDRALVVYDRDARRHALAVLDARRDGRLHEPRPVAAVRLGAVASASQHGGCRAPGPRRSAWRRGSSTRWRPARSISST